MDGPTIELHEPKEDEIEEQQIAPEGQEPAVVPEEIEEEEMPDDLLSPAELEERKREREARPKTPAEPREEDERQRTAIREEFRGIFTGLGGAATQDGGQAAPAKPQRPVRVKLTDEQAQALSDKILSAPGGIARALEAAVELGRRGALEDVAAESGGLLQTTGETVAEKFATRKMRDPSEKFANQIEKEYNTILEGYDLSELARMDVSARNRWLDSIWDQAGGRVLRAKATVKPASSPGVGRGAGARSGPPNRTSRVVTRLSESDKQQLYNTLPKTEEGRRRGARQIWEIEHGVTSDAKIARAVGDASRFSEAVGFGG